MDKQQQRSTLERRVLENLSSSILLFDQAFILKYINPAGEMLFAVSTRQVIGQHAADLIHCPGGTVESNLRRASESGQPFTEREITLPLADGREITVDCTVVPLRDDNGGEELLVELQQLDRQLRINREEELISQGQVSRALVRGMAHEIKNPLGGLRGAAQLLERELPDEALKEYTQIIIAEADRLQNLVNSMLGPNRLPQKRAFSIHQVLERICNLVQVEAGDRLRIQKNYDPSIPDVVGDFDQLIQALLNILRNAVRAVGNKGVVGLKTRVLRQFTIGNERHRLVLKVDIFDNGPGIPESLQNRIFFPMVSGSSDGMGVGLSIAQSLINQHRGLIEFASRPGETIFTVLLPLESS